MTTTRNFLPPLFPCPRLTGEVASPFSSCVGLGRGELLVSAHPTVQLLHARLALRHLPLPPPLRFFLILLPQRELEEDLDRGARRPRTAPQREELRQPRNRPWLPPEGVEGPVALARSSPRAPPPLLPALAIFCPPGAAWCCDSARAMATLRRSCRQNCLSRRSFRLRAAPACSPLTCYHMKVPKKGQHKRGDTSQ